MNPNIGLLNQVPTLHFQFYNPKGAKDLLRRRVVAGLRRRLWQRHVALPHEREGGSVPRSTRPLPDTNLYPLQTDETVGVSVSAGFPPPRTVPVRGEVRSRRRLRLPRRAPLDVRDLLSDTVMGDTVMDGPSSSGPVAEPVLDSLGHSGDGGSALPLGDLDSSEPGGAALSSSGGSAGASSSHVLATDDMGTETVSREVSVMP